MALSDQQPFIEKVDIMLSKTKELQTIKKQYSKVVAKSLFRHRHQHQTKQLERT